MESKRTFYWFDYETFGADPKRDRPAQFGGIRTDEDLKVISKPELLYCQPADDYLPDPQASMVTGLTPLSCLDEGESEAVFAEKINLQLSKPGTIAVGYNNLSFDDEITRFMFWRNLIDPYGREYGDGRARFDLYNLVKTIYAFKPDAIKWPTTEDGQVSMRLENLTKANNIAHSHAHDALSDAEATLNLAKLIKEREPNLWNYALKCTDQNFLKETLSAGHPLLMINPYAGRDKRYLSLIFPLVCNQSRKEWLCWDMSADPKEIMNISADDIKNRLFVSREQRLEGVEPLPLIHVRTNKFPFLVKAAPYMKQPRIPGILGVTLEEFLARAEYLSKLDRGIGASFMSALSSNREAGEIDQSEIEINLYGSPFLTPADRARFNDLRNTDPDELGEKAGGMDFDDENLASLVFRYRARNYPETLETDAEGNLWYNYRLSHLVDGKGGSRTFKQFYARLDELEQQNPDYQDVFDDLRAYAEQLQSDLEVEE